MKDTPDELISGPALSRLLGRYEGFIATKIERGEITPDALVRLGSGRPAMPAFRVDRVAELGALAAGRVPSIPQPPRLAA